MKAKSNQRVLTLCLTLVFLLALLPGSVLADETSGEWKYTVTDGEATITGITGIEGDVTVPSTIDRYPVTVIGDYVFMGRSKIYSVAIPDSVTSIGDSVFLDCSDLKEISVSADNQYYSSAEGVLFNQGKTELLQYPLKRKGDYTIPDSVTGIGEDAFHHCRSLTGVSIPDSVTSIGETAFLGCDSLTGVGIPDSVASIGEAAFAWCSNLTEINVAADNRYYSSAEGVLFNQDKTKLVQYPAGKQDESIYTIPNSVTSIGYLAFSGCSLTHVSIPNSVTDIGDAAFSRCHSLTHVSIPDSLTSIGSTVFAGCSLTHVSIPDSVISIGHDAFSDCSSLTHVSIPNSVTSIGYLAFSGCSSLTHVSIPDSVTSIGSGSFASCSSLTQVSIPDSVTSIRLSAFVYCNALTDVYYAGSAAKWQRITIEGFNDPLLNATIHYNSDPPEEPETPVIPESVEDTLPTAQRYVPYSEAIPAVMDGSSFTVDSRPLPQGLMLSEDGVVSGMPTEIGGFSFTVLETWDGGNTTHNVTLFVFTQSALDVEANNEPGYGFVETVGDDGRVQNQTVASREELTDQTMHCEAAYDEFRSLYLDTRLLTRGVDYTVQAGSTKITISAETIGEAGGGIHTLAAEFVTAGGRTVYTVQNYSVAGIASREVHVEVKGNRILWTDSEPYIDANKRTLTPFRAVGEALGLTVGWNGETREASFSDGSKTVFFPIGGTTAYGSDGSTVEMDTSAVIVNGRTYAPIRYLAEFFGYQVGWDGRTRTVIIQ